MLFDETAFPQLSNRDCHTWMYSQELRNLLLPAAHQFLPRQGVQFSAESAFQAISAVAVFRWNFQFGHCATWKSGQMRSEEDFPRNLTCDRRT